MYANGCSAPCRFLCVSNINAAETHSDPLHKSWKDENKQACDLMLHYSEDLRLAHRMKEWFCKDIHDGSVSSAAEGI